MATLLDSALGWMSDLVGLLVYRDDVPLPQRRRYSFDGNGWDIVDDDDNEVLRLRIDPEAIGLPVEAGAAITPGLEIAGRIPETVVDNATTEAIFEFTPTQDGQFTIKAALFATDGTDFANYEVIGSFSVTAGAVVAIVETEIVLEHATAGAAGWVPAWSETDPTVTLEFTSDATNDTTISGTVLVGGIY